MSEKTIKVQLLADLVGYGKIGEVVETTEADAKRLGTHNVSKKIDEDKIPDPEKEPKVIEQEAVKATGTKTPEVKDTQKDRAPVADALVNPEGKKVIGATEDGQVSENKGEGGEDKSLETFKAMVDNRTPEQLAELAKDTKAAVAPVSDAFQEEAELYLLEAIEKADEEAAKKEAESGKKGGILGGPLGGKK